MFFKLYYVNILPFSYSAYGTLAVNMFFKIYLVYYYMYQYETLM